MTMFVYWAIGMVVMLFWTVWMLLTFNLPVIEILMMVIADALVAWIWPLCLIVGAYSLLIDTDDDDDTYESDIDYNFFDD